MSGLRRTRRTRTDRLELTVLAGFALLSCWILAVDLWQVTAHSWHWTGTAGVFLVDQMQYVAWIQDASRHALISDLFTLSPTSHDLFEPLILISGALRALGVSAWLALLVWQPIAIAALWLAARAYVHRSLADAGAQRAALACGLFAIGPGALLLGRIFHAGLATTLRLGALTDDLWLGFWSWGYPLGLVALAAMLGAIVTYDAARAGGGRGVRPALLGALTAVVHPWQGAVLLLVLAGCEAIAWARGEPPAAGRAGLVLGATALPLVYFAVLDRADPTWRMSEQAAQGSYPVWMVVLTLAPLGVPALLGYRRLPADFPALATRLWPLAAIAVFTACEAGLGAVAPHAFLGVTLALAVLAAEGLREVAGRRVLAGLLAAFAVLCAAAIADQLSTARRLLGPGPPHGQASGPGDANLVRGDEWRALSFLAADPRPGGVLTRFYLGSVVPGVTGRQTYTGNPYYSPGYLARAGFADQLFSGALSSRAAQSGARGTGARFLLADCTSPPRVRAELAPISRAVRRFGCATVYALR